MSKHVKSTYTFEDAEFLGNGAQKSCLECTVCFDEDLKRSLGAQRDLTRAVGYAELPKWFATEGLPENAWLTLRNQALTMRQDPYIGHPNYRRSYGRFLWIDGLIIPLDGVKLSPAMVAPFVSGFDIGSANPENPGQRVFCDIAQETKHHPATARIIRLAVELDPCDPRAKKVMIVTVFFQAALVTAEHPTIQAAPPNVPHNDECRFKANFLVAKHNLQNGATYFLPREFANEPFDETAKHSVLKQVMLEEPGQGYCFLDDQPGEGENRVPNCHYAEAITLGSECDLGYRIVATVTPAPLLPSGGTKAEIERAYECFRSTTTALLDLERIVREMPAAERERVLDILT